MQTHWQPMATKGRSKPNNQPHQHHLPPLPESQRLQCCTIAHGRMAAIEDRAQRVVELFALVVLFLASMVAALAVASFI